MRTPVTVLFAAMALALLAGPCLALDDVILNDGSVHRAEILEVTESGIKVRFRPKSGGAATMAVPARRLDPHFFYDLRDEAAGDDAKEHLKLGLWAVEQGLFSRAKLQVRKAAEIDPQLVKDIREGKLPEIREGIAQRVLDSAKADMDAGRLDIAEQKVEALLARMPDTAAGTEAADVIGVLKPMIDAQEARLHEEELGRLAEEERKAQEARDELLAPVDKDLARGKDLMTDGLTEDSDQQSLKLLKSALSKGTSALKKLDKLATQHGQEAVLMKEVEERRTKTVAAMVKIHIHRGDIYVWRGDTKKAREEFAAASALDPGNAALPAFGQRIEARETESEWDIQWQRARRAGGGRFRSRPGGGRGGGGRR